MKVLFIASGHKGKNRIAPFIQAQGDALSEEGIEMSYFAVEGKGAMSYLRSVPLLRKRIEADPPDLIHAHYSLCGWVAVLAGTGKPIVLSLMGDDAYGDYIAKDRIDWRSSWLPVVTWMIQPFVDVLISKSANIARHVYRPRISHIIPNGVRLDQFRLYPGGCREELGLRPDKQYVLFLGDRNIPRKNFALADAAVRLLGRPDVELINPFPLSHGEVVKYLNSADVFVLCSFMEGSPNVVKEAMACNCPIVTTDVGDAAWVTGDTPGCVVSSFHAAEFAGALAQALDYAATNGRTEGRQRLIQLGLSASDVAQRICAIYAQLLHLQPQPE